MNKKDGRQHKDGHRLGYVSAPMWARMQEYCEAFGITANDLTVRAIDSFLLEWEEEITEEIEMNDVCLEWEGAGWYVPQQRGRSSSEYTAWKFVGNGDEPGNSQSGKFDPWGTPSWFNTLEEIESPHPVGLDAW